MNRLTPQRAAIFILVMTVVAILMYQGRSRREEQREAEISKQQQRAEAEAAQQQSEAHDRITNQQQKIAAESAHAEFVNQYVDKNITRTAGTPLIAVAVAAENKTMNHAMGQALIKRFEAEHAAFSDSFFKPPLVSDGLFNDVFNGSAALFAKLEITNTVDGLLLARQTVEYSSNPALDNVITANMRVEVVMLPVAGRLQSQAWTFIANGTGFREPEARMRAEERIVKQMTDKSDMSLGLIDPAK